MAFFFFFFRWRYSPLWALACRTIAFHFPLSITNSLHLLTPSTWRSLPTSSLHPFLGLPLRLVPSSSWVKIFLGGIVNIFVIMEYTWNSRAFIVWLLVSLLRVTKRYVVIGGKLIVPKKHYSFCIWERFINYTGWAVHKLYRVSDLLVTQVERFVSYTVWFVHKLYRMSDALIIQGEWSINYTGWAMR